MNTQRRGRRLTWLPFTLAAALLAMTSCTNTETASEFGAAGHSIAASTSTDPAAAALLPERIKAAGELTIVTDPTYAPITYTDSQGNVIGLEPDLALAVAQKLGLRLKVEKADFNGIIAGIEARRYDASWAAFNVTADRLQRVSMVSTRKSGTAVAVRKGNPEQISSSLDLCGKTIAAQTGNVTALTVLPAFQQQCTDAGRAPLKTLILPQQDNVNQALSTGRADAMAADKALISYYSDLLPEVFDQVPQILVAPALIGVVLNSSDQELARAFQAALDSLIRDGGYQRILDAWGLGDTAISAAAIDTPFA